jgi:alpha-amylase
MTRLARQLLACAMTLACLAPLAPAVAAAPEKPLSQRDWRDEVIYVILVDRFANGDKSNDGPHANPADPSAYHGGDLQGVIDHLDYLKDLGVTALWLTPVNDNQDAPLDGKYWGYHGYWIDHFDRVDEHFGSEQTLKTLVAQAHARGLKVLIDCIANHPGYDAAIAKDPSKRDWFHHNGRIQNWDDPYENENYDLAGLPDFASENKAVLDFHTRAWTAWQTRTGIDGFRVDTVRHVPIAFWHRFNQAVDQAAPDRAFTVGEISYHDPAKLPPYLGEGGFDSAFDFPMLETLRDVFAKDGSFALLSARLKQDALYADPRMLSPFLDNHDEDRFLTVARGDERKLRLALACLATMRGIPSLYYGTEVGMTGGHDPDNRKDMAWGRNPALTAYVRQLFALRKATPALRRGAMAELYSDRTGYAFARGAGAQGVLVALNNADAPRTLRVPVSRVLGWKDGTALSDRLKPQEALAFRVRGGTVAVTLGPRQARVLMP